MGRHRGLPPTPGTISQWPEAEARFPGTMAEPKPPDMLHGVSPDFSPNRLCSESHTRRDSYLGVSLDSFR